MRRAGPGGQGGRTRGGGEAVGNGGTDPDGSEGNEAADVGWEDLSGDPNTIKHLLSVLLLKCTNAGVGFVCGGQRQRRSTRRGGVKRG